MHSETSHLSDASDPDCPLPQSHGRLDQAHRLWHLALGAYPDADEFVLHLNNLVQGIRNVSFILQNEMKEVIPDPKTWYSEWQRRMKSDRMMTWLNDSRVQVVHRGDLEADSTVRISVLADWHGDHPIAEFDMPPFVSPDAIAASLATVDVPEQVRREGILSVERRWVEQGLPDMEVLDVIAHCYGFLRTLLADAHRQAGFVMSTMEIGEDVSREWNTTHLGGRLPCMLASADLRTARLVLSTGELITPGMREVFFGPTSADDTYARYGFDHVPTDLTRHDGDPFLQQAEFFAETAKQMLVVDKRHSTFAFLPTQQGEMRIVGIEAQDQAEKYPGHRAARQGDTSGGRGPPHLHHRGLGGRGDDGRARATSIHLG